MEILLELNLKQKLGTRLGIGLTGFLLYFLVCSYSTMASLVLGALLALMMHSPTNVFAFVMTCKRDAVGIVRFLALNWYMLKMEKLRKWTVVRAFLEVANLQPNKVCFIMDNRQLSYADAALLVHKIAEYFQQQGLKQGDCVALLMETCVEYPCMWLGLSKLGIVTALINNNLRRDTLLHALKVANAKALIVSNELSQVVQELRDAAELSALHIYQYAEQQKEPQQQLLTGATDLNSALASVELPAQLHRICGNVHDKLLYVYTSGTTGLPKAAVISNRRFLFMSAGVFHMLRLERKDIIYNTLPLYHTAGGIVGIGNALLNGSTVVLRRRFSASQFWLDCSRHNCTVAQYIGELCRYLLATKYTPEQCQHSLRLMYGNGLRPQIWTKFVSRFGIPRIGEVYGATEGNANLININGQTGAIGFMPLLARSLCPVRVIRCNEQTGEPLRNAQNGFIECAPGEPGLLLGRVDKRFAAMSFNGYADEKATEQKLLRLSKRNVYFNSGDMIVYDILGYCYFKDRTGDTFRWRGENVATQEVEAIITNCIGLRDCVVFGVQVPHVEGKAGMAAILDAERQVNMEYLSVGIRGSLPAYARPLFIRLMDEIPRTATFKLKKTELAQEGYDINSVKDPIYYLNRSGCYELLTMPHYEAILAGTAGL